MPVAVWSDQYETGIEVIDAQHRSLFEAINRLADAFRAGWAEAGARESLAFLDRYSREHFDTEEEFMRVVGYPGLKVHRMEHTVLLTKVQNLLVKMDEGFLISADVATFAADWLAHHIHEADMGYVRYTREKLAKLA
jgi:hemerythrin-like metal-binding protein